MAKFEHADAAFFSRRTILFEGESDDSFFRHVARLLNTEWDFESKNVALVRVSGKGNFGRFRSFFEAFGIEVKIVADLDALFEGFQHLGALELEQHRSRSIHNIDARIQVLDIAAEPSARQVKAKVKSGSAPSTLLLVYRTCGRQDPSVRHLVRIASRRWWKFAASCSGDWCPDAGDHIYFAVMGFLNALRCKKVCG